MLGSCFSSSNRWPRRSYPGFVQAPLESKSAWLACSLAFRLIPSSVSQDQPVGGAREHDRATAGLLGPCFYVSVALVLQASTWTEEGQRLLTELEQEHPEVVLQRLQLHWTRHPDLPPAHFRKMWALATGLGSESIRQECRWAWAQCQDTWLALDQKREAALKPPSPSSTATLYIRRTPAIPTVPPLRKAYSFDRNLGKHLQDASSRGHCAAIVTDCHRPEARGGDRPRSSPSVPLSGSSDFRSPNRYRQKAGQGGLWRRVLGPNSTYLIGYS